MNCENSSFTSRRAEYVNVTSFVKHDQDKLTIATTKEALPEDISRKQVCLLEYFTNETGGYVDYDWFRTN